MFSKAIIAVACFFIIDYFTHNLIISCLGIVLANIIILLIYDYHNVKSIGVTKTKFTKEANLRILKTGLFTFILNFLAIYLINVPRYAIDDLLTSDIQTIFGIIIMPATFMGLLGQYIIQPVLTSISDNIKNHKYIDLKKSIAKIIIILFILGIIVIFVAWLLEIPVLELVYGVELKPYFISAIIIIIGSVFYGASTMTSYILIAMRKTLSQVITYGICAILSTVVAYKLVENIRSKGSRNDILHNYVLNSNSICNSTYKRNGLL